MTGHPEIGEHVAQRDHARGPKNTWKVQGRTDDLTNGPDSRPALLLQRVDDPDRTWAVSGMPADEFWQEFVRVEREGT